MCDSELDPRGVILKEKYLGPLLIIIGLLCSIRDPENQNQTLGELGVIQPHFITTNGKYISVLIFDFWVENCPIRQSFGCPVTISVNFQPLDIFQ